MRPRRVLTKKVLLLLLGLAAATTSTGCKQIIGLIQMVMSGGGGGIFNPPGSSGGGGILPPNLGGGGGPLSPNSSLPPPAASQQTVQQILQQYGVPVTGSGATPENLSRVVDAMRRYKREHYQGLTQIHVPQGGGGGIAGLWQSWGRGAKITLYAKSGWRVPVSRHTSAHEIAHHVSLFSRPEVMGRPFSQALGTGSNAYPTNYSYTNWKEQIAENLALILLGKDDERSFHSGWRPTAAAMRIVEQEFGRSWSTQGGTSATGTGTGTTGPTGAGGPSTSSTPRPGAGLP